MEDESICEKEFLLSLQDFHRICRLCLSTGYLLETIFNTNVLSTFKIITNIQVEPNDTLPKNICSKCIEKLKDISVFVAECVNNDARLKVIIAEDGNYLFPIEPMEEKIVSNIKQEPEENVKADDKNDTQLSEGPSQFLEANCKESGELVTQCKKRKNCKKKIFQCNVCPMVYDERHKLFVHSNTHSDEKLFKCDVCDKKFTYFYNWKKHINFHEGITPFKPFTCNLCGRAFKRQLVRDEHMNSHTGATPFVCTYCGQAFTRSSYLYKHTRRHKELNGEIEVRKNPEKKAECTVCLKTFSSKTARNTHLLSHTGEKSFLCNVCGKNFVTQGALTSHSTVHAGIKPFTCPECDKTFARRRGLKVHMLSHSGEKPHTCELCNKSFVQSNHLKTHLKTHTGEKPYSCTFCNKRFALSFNLKVHTRTHTGETPYHCPCCNLGFYDSSSMKKHYKNHELDGIKDGHVNGYAGESTENT